MSSPALFPRRTLEDALRVPRAIKKDNAVGPSFTATVARALKLAPNSDEFGLLTAASQAYGLTDGTSETTQIALTPLGHKAMYPMSKEEEADVLTKAFFNIETFKRWLEVSGRGDPPDPRTLADGLRTLNIPDDQRDEFIELVIKNCKFLRWSPLEAVSPPHPAKERRARARGLAWLPFTIVSGISLYRRQGLGMHIFALSLIPVMILIVFWWVRRREGRR